MGELCRVISAFGTGITDFKILDVPIERVVSKLPLPLREKIESTIEEGCRQVKREDEIASIDMVMRSNKDFFIIKIGEDEISCQTIKFCHEGLLVRCNGVVENFAQGLGKATFYEFKPQDIADPAVLGESIQHSWYEYPGKDGESLHPWSGVTKAKFTGPKTGTQSSWKELNEEGKYSWLKTPTWCGKMAEVGPLARYIIIYTKARKNVLGQPTWAEQLMLDQIDAVSKVLNLAPEVWMPTMWCNDYL